MNEPQGVTDLPQQLRRHNNLFITSTGSTDQVNNSTTELQRISDTEVTIFTDGSLTNGTNMGVGLYVELPSGGHPLALSFRIQDLPASSYTSELVGILL
jgi:hypothetical protein